MKYDFNEPTVWASRLDGRLFLCYRRNIMTAGRIHSFESMGLVDGPGIRSVVFLQGCNLRCQYCHNPDTWDKLGSTEEMSAKEIVERLKRFKPYYGNNGGVTFSGGEPLLQNEFLEEAFELCKKEGIHTCIDTSGVGNGDYEAILRNTDLILFDVKHYTREGYRLVTGQEIDESLRFLEKAQEMNIPLWIRHVVVPGLTDSKEHLEGLVRYVKTLKNVERTELLPYHVLGVHKYKELGIPYKLEGVPPMNKEELIIWQNKLKGDR